LDRSLLNRCGLVRESSTTNPAPEIGHASSATQTGPEGKIVQRVYIEVAEPFEREIYLGFVLDRKVERVRVIASRFGGMDIEEIAKDHPEEILQVVVEPAVGLQPFEALTAASPRCSGEQPRAKPPFKAPESDHP
jgi:succinyl-CoA synthetase beta subunit